MFSVTNLNSTFFECFRFVRVEIHSPELYVRCETPMKQEMKAIKSQYEEEYPCRQSSNITDYDKIKEIDVCLWEGLEFIVSFEFFLIL